MSCFTRSSQSPSTTVTPGTPRRSSRRARRPGQTAAGRPPGRGWPGRLFPRREDRSDHRWLRFDPVEPLGPQPGPALHSASAGRAAPAGDGPRGPRPGAEPEHVRLVTPVADREPHERPQPQTVRHAVPRPDQSLRSRLGELAVRRRRRDGPVARRRLCPRRQAPRWHRQRLQGGEHGQRRDPRPTDFHPASDRAAQRVGCGPVQRGPAGLSWRDPPQRRVSGFPRNVRVAGGVVVLVGRFSPPARPASASCKAFAARQRVFCEGRVMPAARLPTWLRRGGPRRRPSVAARPGGRRLAQTRRGTGAPRLGCLKPPPGSAPLKRFTRDRWAPAAAASPGAS